MRGVIPSMRSALCRRRSIESVTHLNQSQRRAENQIVEQMEIEDTDGVEALPGVLALLNSLPSNRWTVVTSATDPRPGAPPDRRHRRTGATSLRKP